MNTILVTTRVMTAIGKGEFSRNTLRFSFSRYNTEEEAVKVLEALHCALGDLARTH